MDGMTLWLIWPRVILFRLHTVTFHHAKIKLKNYLPRDSMSKQERHLWEPKHFACHLIQSNHSVKRLKANVFALDVISSQLVLHSLEDRTNDRDHDRTKDRWRMKMVLGNNISSEIVQKIKSNFFRNKFTVKCH